VEPHDQDVWLVQTKSGELRSMTRAGLHAAYRSGAIDDASLVLSFDLLQWLPFTPSAPSRGKKRVATWTLLCVVLGGAFGAAFGLFTSLPSAAQPVVARGALPMPALEAPPKVEAAETKVPPRRMKGRHRRASPFRHERYAFLKGRESGFSESR